MVERMSSQYYLKILCRSVFPMDVSHVVSALASGLVVGWLAKAFDLSKISSGSSSQPAALHCHCTCDCPENSKNGLIIFGLAGTLILVLAFSLIWLGVRRIEIPVAVPHQLQALLFSCFLQREEGSVWFSWRAHCNYIMNAGDLALHDYGEVPEVLRSRLLLAQVVGDSWVILTPDHDMYEEQLSPHNPDLKAFYFLGPGGAILDISMLRMSMDLHRSCQTGWPTTMCRVEPWRMQLELLGACMLQFLQL